jgi:hypothetical protein
MNERTPELSMENKIIVELEAINLLSKQLYVPNPGDDSF